MVIYKLISLIFVVLNKIISMEKEKRKRKPTIGKIYYFSDDYKKLTIHQKRVVFKELQALFLGKSRAEMFRIIRRGLRSAHATTANISAIEHIFLKNANIKLKWGN